MDFSRRQRNFSRFLIIITILFGNTDDFNQKRSSNPHYFSSFHSWVCGISSNVHCEKKIEKYELFVHVPRFSSHSAHSQVSAQSEEWKELKLRGRSSKNSISCLLGSLDHHSLFLHSVIHTTGSSMAKCHKVNHYFNAFW